MEDTRSFRLLLQSTRPTIYFIQFRATSNFPFFSHMLSLTLSLRIYKKIPYVYIIFLLYQVGAFWNRQTWISSLLVTNAQSCVIFARLFKMPLRIRLISKSLTLRKSLDCSPRQFPAWVILRISSKMPPSIRLISWSLILQNYLTAELVASLLPCLFH